MKTIYDFNPKKKELEHIYPKDKEAYEREVSHDRRLTDIALLLFARGRRTLARWYINKCNDREAIYSFNRLFGHR